MSTSLFIAIPVHNRLDIAERCIPTVRAGMAEGDALWLFNDGSDDMRRVIDLTDDRDGLLHSRTPIGIEAQRRVHFKKFWEQTEAFTHLYLADADAPHDPNWRTHLLHLQELSGGLPVCGYNTLAHECLVGNTIEDDPTKPYLLRRVAPGISYLLTRKHVERIMPHVDTLQHWDWQVPGLLGYRMCVARQSHVSHIGQGGMHHPKEGEGDVPLNPTPWLVEKRKEIVEALKK